MVVLAGTWLSLSPGAADAGITVTAPRDGALLGTAAVTLSGRIDGTGDGTLDLVLNGRKLAPVAVRKGRFAAALSLNPGKNSLTLRSAAAGREVEFEYRAGAGAGAYRFHPGYAEGECAECHDSLASGQSSLCHTCHESKDVDPFLHGPVGAGQCTFCHDPHGSSHEFFLTAAGPMLCVKCHDQPSSRGHVQSSAGKSCEKCHNPHGSHKKFFLY